MRKKLLKVMCFFLASILLLNLAFQTPSIGAKYNEYDEVNEPIYEYDDQGRVVKVGYETGDWRTLEYEVNVSQEIIRYYDSQSKSNKGELSKTFITEKHEPNEFGSVMTVTDIDKLGTEITEYDDLDNITRKTDRNGRTQVSLYDSYGYKTKEIYPYTKDSLQNEQIAIHYKYDSEGKLLKKKVPFDVVNGEVVYSVQHYKYNYKGYTSEIAISCNEPGEPEKFTKTRYEHDGNGNIILSANYDTDGNMSTISQYYHDKYGHVIREYSGMSTPLVINGLDVIIGSGYNVTKYEYKTFCEDEDADCDEHEMLLSAVIDPLGNRTDYTKYDEYGNIAEMFDKNGNRHTYTYNMGIFRASYAIYYAGNNTDTPDELKVYHQTDDDKLVQVDTNSGLYQTDYDEIGNVSQVIDENGNITEYAYNDANELEAYKITTSDGQIISDVHYEFNKDGKVEAVYEGNDKTPVIQYSYDFVGRKIREEFRNGTVSEYTYSIGDHVKEIRTKNRNGGYLTHYRYNYKLDNKMTEAEECISGKSTKYTYDSLGRLEKEENSRNGKIEYNFSYSYDASNNRKSVKQNGKSLKSSYDRNNRLVESGVETINYDDNGNMLEKGSDSYEYDGNNRLIRYSDGEKTVDYTYSADGKLSSRTVNGHTQYLVWANNSLAALIEEEGETEIFVNDKNNVTISKISEDEEIYFQTNNQGRVLGVWNDEAELLDSQEYDAFGKQLTDDDSSSLYIGYTGELCDPVSDLVFLNSRFYSPEIGRFLTEDTFAGLSRMPESANRYIYCVQDPVNYTDPSGHWAGTDHQKLANEIAITGDSNNALKNWMLQGALDGDAVYHKYQKGETYGFDTISISNPKPWLWEKNFKYINNNENYFGATQISGNVIHTFASQVSYNAGVRSGKYWSNLAYIMNLAIQVKAGYHTNAGSMTLRKDKPQFTDINFDLLLGVNMHYGDLSPANHAAYILGIATHLAADIWAHASLVRVVSDVNNVFTDIDMKTELYNSGGPDPTIITIGDLIYRTVAQKDILKQEVADFKVHIGDLSRFVPATNTIPGVTASEFDIARGRLHGRTADRTTTGFGPLRFDQAGKAVRKIGALYNTVVTGMSVPGRGLYFITPNQANLKTGALECTHYVSNLAYFRCTNARNPAATGNPNDTCFNLFESYNVRTNQMYLFLQNRQDSN